MTISGQSTGEYPLYGYIVVNGRYIEGMTTCPRETAQFLSIGGNQLPADLQMRSCAPIPLQPRQRLSVVQ